MNNYNKNLEDFHANGFTIFTNYFSNEQVNELGEMMVNGYKDTLDSDINDKNISEIISRYEKEEKFDELYKSFKTINSSPTLKRIGKDLIRFYQDLTKKNSKLINTGYAIGIKNSKRTAYDWHQEKPYYEDSETIHFQFSILHPCTKENGTMSVLEGSQKIGYITNVDDKKLHAKSVNSFVPKEIETYLDQYEEKHFIMSLNDLSMFHENIIHKSNKNNSDLVRFAGIIRLEIIE